ncbi:uncharacterized protein [Clytia hemisphaerica]
MFDHLNELDIVKGSRILPCREEGVIVSGMKSLSGVITSPEWPIGFHRHYPTSCLWRIKAQKGFVIQLNLVFAGKVFESILQSCGKSPHLRITGKTSNGMEALCNHMRGSSLTLNTQSNEVEIRMSYTSGKFTRGFVLGWTTFKKPVEASEKINIGKILIPLLGILLFFSITCNIGRMCRRRQQQVCERNLISHDAHTDQIGRKNSIFIENGKTEDLARSK